MSVLRTDSFNPALPELGVEAGRWLIRFVEPDPEDPDDTPEIRNPAFMHWIRQSSRHLGVFLETYETYHRLGVMDPACEIDVSALLKEARASRTVLQKRARWAAAAVLAVLTLGLVVPRLFVFKEEPITWTVYSTPLGKHQRFTMEDKSTLVLNTASRVEVSLRPKLREVRLLQGEALFGVQHESRPFVVHTGDLSITDLGTEFAVYRRSSDTRVTVVDGQVQLTRNTPTTHSTSSGNNSVPHSASATLPRPMKLVLSGGDQVELSDEGDLHIEHGKTKEEVRQATAWKDGHLYFYEATIAAIAQEFNRYNKKHLVIVDPEIAILKTSVLFPSPDPDQLIQLLRERWDVRVLPPDPKDPDAIRLGRAN